MLFRLILGITFIAASIPKIRDPGQFAQIIYGYYLFPDYIINLSAIILPFIELIAGVSLIVGFYPKSAALAINGLLLIFILAIGINLIRGHQFDCGCFSVTGPDKVASAVWLLIRDIILFIMGVYLWAAAFKQSKQTGWL